MNPNKELVIGIHGDRRAGKDCLGSYIASCFMLGDVTCKSNMPIGGKWVEGTVQAEPLDAAELYKFGQGFDRNILIYFSEIDKLVHRRRSISNANMLLNVLATQIGKKGISIIATCQDWFWLDDEWIRQTDILIHCREAAFTPWGHDENLPEGHYTIVNVYNISGVVDGPRYATTGKAMSTFTFPMRMMWDRKVNPNAPLFDSYKIMGVEEMMSKVVIERSEYHLYMGRGQGQAGPLHHIEHYLPRSHALDTIRATIEGLRAAGHRYVPGEELRDLITKTGYQGNPSGIGQYIARIPGVRRDYSGRGKTVVYEILPDSEGYYEPQPELAGAR